MLKVLLEPQLKINELITIESEVMSRFNGTYKIISIQHTGNISPSKGRTVITNIETLTTRQR